MTALASDKRLPAVLGAGRAARQPPAGCCVMPQSAVGFTAGECAPRRTQQSLLLEQYEGAAARTSSEDKQRQTQRTQQCCGSIV